mmetsp:Transcript_39330/g.47657  ORF Transcript_39330/g.47657 Transcript_39330/m.47657 type:complete len:407 (-) Transcript_39330:165-1385(-)|eukprot:CAMPEP_0197851378 /NCGR_PEP_ID=MMETSP1438-20131217/17931_1 /TAXON_ID=1461541 /ORGANISM="Pterosperma sp., Strain CCMP1384" /LENGTH=406 /DNA_ID=CAMNT_0043464959 /DNA_START=91 /DNA_END=1311 /DNA_ORIENTATION=+
MLDRIFRRGSGRKRPDSAGGVDVKRCHEFPATGKPDIVAKDLVITKTDTPGQLPELETLLFGKTFADHMLTIRWKDGLGWTAPEITKLEHFGLHPAVQAVHYGMQCFEGMKCYKGEDGSVRLFRPDMNMARFGRSCERLALPSFDQAELLECIKKLVDLDQHWIPDKEGYSLYLRPTAMGTTPTLGIAPPSEAIIFCICCPVGPYFPSGLSPVSLFLSESVVRAWPNGVGAAKVGGNYAPTVAPQVAAKKSTGCAQVLYTFRGHGDGDENLFVSESGAMNVFFHFKKKDGGEELVTPPLDGTILPGVTRDSALTLVREWGEIEVNERPLTVKELMEAIKEERLLSVFGTGTACVLQPVNGMHRENGEILSIPFDASNENSLQMRLYKTLLAIQHGKEDHGDWSIKV